MTIWSGEIQELDKLYGTFKGHLPDIVKEMEQLIRTDDANVVMLYSRRCLEVIVTDLCETELKRPRKTEPLKGIIDKLGSEEKVPSNIIASMQSLNTMSTFGTHPKDFDPEQVKPVLNNLAIIIRWYLKYKDFHVVSKTELPVEKQVYRQQELKEEVALKPAKKKTPLFYGILLGIAIVFAGIFITNFIIKSNEKKKRALDLLARSGSFIDPRDNQVYKTIMIGNQVWMSENLRANLYNDGTQIPLETVDTVWWELKTPAYSWYNNDKEANMIPYGALYNWHAVNTGKLCPVGWHVPTGAEWTTLTDFLGGQSLAGDKLKEAGDTTWKNIFSDEEIKPTNASGFTALPGGFRGCGDVQPTFESMGYAGSWWSSTAEYENFAFRVRLEGRSPTFWKDEAYTSVGFSVRCIKDSN